MTVSVASDLHWTSKLSQVSGSLACERKCPCQFLTSFHEAIELYKQHTWPRRCDSAIQLARASPDAACAVQPLQSFARVVPGLYRIHHNWLIGVCFKRLLAFRRKLRNIVPMQMSGEQSGAQYTPPSLVGTALLHSDWRQRMLVRARACQC